MINFFKKLFCKKEFEVKNNGTSITEDEEFEFQKQLQSINKKNIEEKDIWIKYVFYQIMRRIFEDMVQEVKASFLTDVKLEYHKDVDYGFNKQGDFIRTIDRSTIIKRKRDIENRIKIEKILLPGSLDAYYDKGIMVYVDMFYTALVETNTHKDESKRRCVAYKTPVRLYMIVDDDDYDSMITKDGLIKCSSVGFIRFGIILPEFASLNLQTKTIVSKSDKYKRQYFLHEIRYNKSPKEVVSRLGILKKRIVNEKSLDRYISEQEIIDDKNDNPFKEIFEKEDIFLSKCKEFHHLFELILNAKSTIFKLKDNERFSTWTSCEKI